MAKVIFCFAVVGCRSNNECAEKQACIAKECRNPCEEKACLRNEVCEVVQHSARCITGKFIFFGFRGYWYFIPNQFAEAVIGESDCYSDGTCFPGKSILALVLVFYLTDITQKSNPNRYYGKLTDVYIKTYTTKNVHISMMIILSRCLLIIPH